MKKSLITLSVIVLSLFSAREAKGQIWLLVDGDLFLSHSIVGSGFGVKGAYQHGELGNNMVTLGGTYNIVGNVNFDLPIYDTTGLFLDSLNAYFATSVITIDADYRHYFFETDADDYVGMYGFAGLSAWLVASQLKWNTTYEDYILTEGFKVTDKSFSLHMPVGVGVDWTIRGMFWWFFEAKVELPLTTVTNTGVGNNFGVSYHLATGARIKLADVATHRLF
ncbi:MAG: hypothetical protein R2794_05895 [Chitinophagales bacterium]